MTRPHGDVTHDFTPLMSQRATFLASLSLNKDTFKGKTALNNVLDPIITTKQEYFSNVLRMKIS